MPAVSLDSLIEDAVQEAFSGEEWSIYYRIGAAGAIPAFCPGDEDGHPEHVHPVTGVVVTFLAEDEEGDFEPYTVVLTMNVVTDPEALAAALRQIRPSVNEGPALDLAAMDLEDVAETYSTILSEEGH